MSPLLPGRPVLLQLKLSGVEANILHFHLPLDCSLTPRLPRGREEARAAQLEVRAGRYHNETHEAV